MHMPLGNTLNWSFYNNQKQMITFTIGNMPRNYYFLFRIVYSWDSFFNSLSAPRSCRSFWLTNRYFWERVWAFEAENVSYQVGFKPTTSGRTLRGKCGHFDEIFIGRTESCHFDNCQEACKVSPRDQRPHIGPILGPRRDKRMKARF